MHRGGIRFYVGDLLPECEDEDLSEYFSKFGYVVEATVVRDRETNLSRCFGFVRMSDPSLVSILPGEHQIWDNSFTVKASDKVADEEGGKIWIGDLPEDITEEELTTYCSKFGQVSEAVVSPDKSSAYVRMSDEKVADWIVKQETHELPQGDKLVIRYFHDRPTGAFGQGAESRFFVGHLPDGVTEEELMSYFGRLGEVTEATIVKDKPFGFVKFATASQELTRIMLEERHEINGRKVEVKREAKGKGRVKKGDTRGDRDGRSGYGRSGDYGYGRGDHGYGRNDQGYSRNEQGYGRNDQGHGKGDRGYGRYDHGYGKSDQGYGKGSYSDYGGQGDYNRGGGQGGDQGQGDYWRGGDSGKSGQKGGYGKADYQGKGDKGKGHKSAGEYGSKGGYASYDSNKGSYGSAACPQPPPPPPRDGKGYGKSESYDKAYRSQPYHRDDSRDGWYNGRGDGGGR